jgi:acyl transferase domain-containing protein/NAD(P)H-dependent flavin oxidoreductase YrpB (nitropropane dioxygenase family)/NAD(P)-dependent dehydrogenase (short-subunit alcohol dehydrogenase family)
MIDGCKTDFRCVTLSSTAPESLGVAVATVRSGGWGLIDCREGASPPELVNHRFDELIRRTAGAIGLPGLALNLVDAVNESLLAQLATVEHVLLVQLPADAELDACKHLVNCPQRVLLLQAPITWNLQYCSGDSLVSADQIDGWVVVGSELTRSDSDSSVFVVAQQALASTDRPVYAQGGFGPRATQAFRAMGCSGVILDEKTFSETPEAPRLLWTQEVADPTRRAGDQRNVEIDEAITRMTVKVGKQYRSTGRLVRAIESGRILPLTEYKPGTDPFSPGSALAESHGTRFPIVQGPMTRVSDVPQFAAAVADAGALPMLALGMMSGADARILSRSTAALMGGRPWGVGILAFAPTEIRDAQITETLSARPDYVIISGGRPDQAQQFEQEGIRAYLHVPTLGFLERFLDAGARRFVFEGRECGGHVGRYGSLQLWEQLGDALLDRSSSDDAREFHVLFAGGIHDRCSAAGAAIMAAPLAQRGMCTGVLMGSAYLMTPEAVDSGAVAPGFQKVITDCTDTVLLQSRPGHVYRVANTPMVQDFEQLRSRLTGEGLSGDQLAYELDLFGLGRSRIATKGEKRDSSGQWLPVSEELQYQEGMYMVGEVATCCTKVNSMNELHDSIALGSQDITAQDSEVRPGWLGSDIQPPPVDVAIIGVAALVPDATHHDTFWRNILDSHSAIIEVPEDRWDWRLYDNDQGTRQDSVLAQWGGFFPEIPFDPRRYGIPPKVMPHIGVPQLLSLEIARRALADAGYEDGNFDRENTSVIMGAADGGGLLGDSLKTRAHLNLIDPNSKAWDRLPEWTEDSFAGVLTNINAGRVANRFDLGGTNVILDAACASGLMAVGKAVNELVDGSANMALAGAVDVGQVPFQFLGFSNTRALSPTGELQPFGRGANGTVTGEAITFVVLKRLVDAERDGDRIYSVIKGIGTSSDGKGLGMTAPQPAGQMRALNRAYARAGFTMSTIGLYEAHGTGTPVGDKAEAETLFTLLQNGGGDTANCAVGSVKSLTGHTKNAAGMVGLIKASLALFHRTLPPHAGIDEPIEVFQQSDSPAYLPNTPRPWLSSIHARRAGVSAFGFGGTNAHAVLEEYPAERAGRSVNYGARHWSPELYLLAAVDRPTAVNACRELAEVISLNSDISSCDLAYSLAVDFDKQLRRSRSETGVMLAFVSASIAELKSDLVKVATSLAETEDGVLQLPANVSMGTGESDQMKVACLFPGQGSQYCGMGQAPALYFEEFRALLELADARYQSELGQRISTLISPAALWSEQEKRSAGEALMRTEVAQPALGVIELAYFQVLQRLGLRCDMVAGHSYGEYVALAAASALRADDLLDLSVSRGQAMANCKSESGDSGTMAAVFASREQLIPVLEQVPGLVLANDNGPGQVVISGAVVDVDQAIELLHQQEIRAVRLPVGGAFHSSLMGAAAQPLAKAIHSVEFSAPTRPVYANSDGAPYAHHPSDIQAQLSQHLLQPVQFAAQIEQMYADGARIFLEVGPGRSLVGLTGQILRDREHTIVALEDGAKGMHGFLAAVGKLAVHGILDNILGLYRDRDPKSINLRDQAEEVDPNFLWYLNGAFSRRANEVQGQYGKEPFLTAATALESRAAVAQPVVSPVEDVPVDQPALGSSEPAILPRPIDGFDEGGIEVYREYHETMRQFLKLQESVMTAFLKGGVIPAEGNSLPDSNEIRGEEKTTAPVGKGSTASTFPVDRSPPSVDRIQASLSSGRSVDTALPSSSPPVEHSAVPAAIPAINMRQTLVGLVSEITGYPEDMLKLDQDLEAELGVDSIKRVEVIESALKLLPDADSEVLRRRVDELIRLKTIAQLADELQPSVGDVPVDTALPSSSPPVEHSAVPADQPSSASEPVDFCPRYLIKGSSEELAITSFDPGSKATRFVGLYLITEDPQGFGLALAKALGRLGAKVGVLTRDALLDQSQITQQIEALRAEHGPVRGVVHLAGLSVSELPEQLSEWREETTVQLKSLAFILSACIVDLRRPGHHRARVISASALGGDFGRGKNTLLSLPISGAAVGLLKSLRYECPEISVRSVDFDQIDPDSTINRLVAELSVPAGHTEVGYVGRDRLAYRAVSAPLPSPALVDGLTPKASWVVVVTGGARGITAQVVKEMACPGMTLLLLGTSPLPAKSEDEELVQCDSVESLRAMFLAKDSEKGDVTRPAEIERRVRDVMRGRQIRTSIEDLENKGARVEYHQIDVRNETAMERFFLATDVRYGAVDAFVHGAGLIEDAYLERKDMASFSRVFDTKVDSAYLIERYLDPKKLKLLLLFSSTAGRFGNAGQGDYAAANETLNRFAWRWRDRFPKAKVVSICWGPWAGAGMASARALEKFRTAGIIPISEKAGTNFLTDEIRRGPDSDVEVIAGEGPWDAMPAVSLDSLFDLGMLMLTQAHGQSSTGTQP